MLSYLYDMNYDSMIEKAAFDDENWLLYIKFINSDSVYIYHDVHPNIWNSFKATARKSYFFDNVIRNRYMRTNVDNSIFIST